MSLRLVTVFALVSAFLSIQAFANECDSTQSSPRYGGKVSVEQAAKEEIAMFSEELNNLNLEFLIKAVRHYATTHEEICWQVGRMGPNFRDRFEIWDKFYSAKMCSSSEQVVALVKKVQDFMTVTKIKIELLSGFCRPSMATAQYGGKPYLGFQKDSQFFAGFDDVILSVLEFQDWARFDLLGEEKPKDWNRSLQNLLPPAKSSKTTNLK